METVATPGLETLVAHAEQALTRDDPWPALVDFLNATLEVQLTDPSVTVVRSAPDRVLPRTTGLTDEMDSLAGRLLERAHIAGAVRSVVIWEDLRPLMCGIATAAQIHTDDQETRFDTGRRYLGVMLRGLHTRTWVQLRHLRVSPSHPLILEKWSTTMTLATSWAPIGTTSPGIPPDCRTSPRPCSRPSPATCSRHSPERSARRPRGRRRGGRRHHVAGCARGRVRDRGRCAGDRRRTRRAVLRLTSPTRRTSRCATSAEAVGWRNSLKLTGHDRRRGRRVRRVGRSRPALAIAPNDVGPPACRRRREGTRSS